MNFTITPDRRETYNNYRKISDLNEQINAIVHEQLDTAKAQFAKIRTLCSNWDGLNSPTYDEKQIQLTEEIVDKMTIIPAIELDDYNIILEYYYCDVDEELYLVFEVHPNLTVTMITVDGDEEHYVHNIDITEINSLASEFVRDRIYSRDVSTAFSG